MEKNSRRERLITENNFVVSIGKTQISFSKVMNISQEAEVENISIGGKNQGPKILVKQNTKEGTLVLERGVARNGEKNLDELKTFKAGRYLGQPLYLYVGSSKSPFHSYYILDGLIKKWEVSKLDAMSNEILIEKLEIVHSGLIYDH